MASVVQLGVGTESGSGVARTSRGALQRAARRCGRELALQDWIALVYLLALLLASVAGDGPRRGTAIGWLTVDLAFLGTALVLVRSRAVTGIGAALLYRLGLLAAVFGSFAHLQYVLPTARSARLDEALYRLDLAVFGLEPAEVFDRWVSTRATEWFSFFYFGYFVLLAVHVFPFLFGSRRVRLLSELSLGLITLFCVGQLLYIVVPGYGPYQHLAGHFTHELDGPVWWRLVRATVDSGEVTARTDIFPSLHTAAPTYLALFAYRHRRLAPFRWTWAPLAFFASQIVISTMYLRWHYLVDVLAGLTLAGAVRLFSARVALWEERRRALHHRTPVWTTLTGPSPTPTYACDPSQPHSAAASRVPGATRATRCLAPGQISPTDPSPRILSGGTSRSVGKRTPLGVAAP